MNIKIKLSSIKSKELAGKKYYCHSCFNHLSKKYRMFKGIDIFGDKSLTCRHCNFSVTKKGWKISENTFDVNELILKKGE